MLCDFKYQGLFIVCIVVYYNEYANINFLDQDKLGAVHLLCHTILASSGPPPTPLAYCVIVWLTPYPPHV